jgi:hypothetical protein
LKKKKKKRKQKFIMAASKNHSGEEEIVTRTTIVPRGLQAAQHTAVEAAQALGRGFDVTSDFRLGFVKGAVGSVLVKIEQENVQNLVAPGGIVIPEVSSDIRCVMGERTHYKSDLLPFVEVMMMLFKKKFLDKFLSVVEGIRA